MSATWEEILTTWEETQIAFNGMNQQLTDAINAALGEYVRKSPQQQATVQDIVNIIRLVSQLNATTNV